MDFIKVLQEYFPLLLFVLTGIGQAVKKIGFIAERTYLLPLIMAVLGMAIGLLIKGLDGIAALEGIAIGLASSGLYDVITAKKE